MEDWEDERLTIHHYTVEGKQTIKIQQAIGKITHNNLIKMMIKVNLQTKLK